VREIKISATMQASTYSSRDTEGLWDLNHGWIIIKRSQLAPLEKFAGTLLHEAIHAKFGLSDVSRDFETYLTNLCGNLAATLIREVSSHTSGERRRGLIASLFGGS
jgi:hypothetical protein